MVFVYKFNGENWEYLTTVDEFEGYDESFQAIPVIAGGKFGSDKSVLLFAWKHPDGLKISGLSPEGYTTPKNSIIPVTIPTTTVHSTSPSLAVESYPEYNPQDSSFFHVVWSEGECNPRI